MQTFWISRISKHIFRDFARDFSGSIRNFSKWRTPRLWECLLLDHYNGKSFTLRNTLILSSWCGLKTAMDTPYTSMDPRTNGKVFDTAKSVLHVGILDAYLSRVLCDVRPTDQFNLQPLPFSPTGIRPWYRSCPLGKSKLQQMVK